MYVCVSVCLCQKCMDAYVCMYVCMCACVYVHMYIAMPRTDRKGSADACIVILPRASIYLGMCICSSSIRECCNSNVQRDGELTKLLADRHTNSLRKHTIKHVSK